MFDLSSLLSITEE
jgi:hypothetical protein